jgi:hypothetical protein
MNTRFETAHYWNNYRAEIYSWFQKDAPSLGELYVSALDMLYVSPLPGWSRFVSHAVREIRNRLPEIISGVRDTSNVQYVNRLDEIASVWDKQGLPLDGSLPTNITQFDNIPTDSIPIPRRIFKKISVLIKEHNDGRIKAVDSAKNLFLGPDREPSVVSESLRPVIDQWLQITGWFVGKAHDSGKTDSNVDFKEFRRQFELFETTLGAILREFFATMSELDEILEEANS